MNIYLVQTGVTAKKMEPLGHLRFETGDGVKRKQGGGKQDTAPKSGQQCRIPDAYWRIKQFPT